MKFLVIIFFLLIGCDNMKPESYSNTEPKIKIEEYFLGNVRAWGIFQGRSGIVKRQFTAKMNGFFDGENFILGFDLRKVGGIFPKNHVFRSIFIKFPCFSKLSKNLIS